MNIQMTELMLTQKFKLCNVHEQCDHKQLQKKWARYVWNKTCHQYIHTKQLVTSMLSVADEEHNSDIISQTE